MKKISKKSIIKIAGVGCAGVALAGAAGYSCKHLHSPAADTVVYGKIYTSNKAQEYAQAIAIKGGKYVYVGSEDGVKPYIKDGKTDVIDYRDRGLIMAGATEGHGHYIGYGALAYLNLTVTGATEKEILQNVKAYIDANPADSAYYTFGWDNVAMLDTKEKIDMKSKLDEICSDKILLIGDDSGHNAFFNSKAAEVAGITKESEIVGGVLSKGADGELLGLASDMAMNYLLKYAIGTQKLFQESDYAGIVNTTQQALHSCGYTNYQDGWTNYFGTQFMDALSEHDKKSGLSVVIAGSYKIDSYDNWKTELKAAKKCAKKYPTKRFKFNTVKLFADGEAVESGSGWLIDGYANGTHGTQVWDDETMNAIVAAANAAGMCMHVHSQGDGAAKQVVNAFINAEDAQAGSIYNGIVHGRNITPATKKEMGQHHIYAAQNINWRVLTESGKEKDEIEAVYADISTYMAGYPIKSLLDAGALVTSSTDVPAAAGAPTTVPGIIEVAVNDTRADFEVVQLDASERVSVETAMDIMTINGAKQLQIEAERGSIEVGKYADFIFINKDISTCEKDKIHEGVVAAVYFEGKQVYKA